MGRINRADIEQLLQEVNKYGFDFKVDRYGKVDDYVLVGWVKDGWKPPICSTLNSRAMWGESGFTLAVGFKTAGEMFNFLEGMLMILRNTR